MSLLSRLRELTEPDSDDLPNGRVLGIPLLAILALFLIFSGFGLTGSSSGIFHSSVANGTDPRLIAGEPRGIRSDEWLVQSSWAIAQVEQGLPRLNQTLPGGMDATVQNDLPALDWSIAFRPHLLGFTFLELDQAAAFKWWLPFFALLAAGYIFFLTMAPSKPITAMALSGTLVFAPFLQWWFLSITFWPLTWSLMIMSTALWLVKSDSLWPKVLLPTVTAYLTVVVAVGIYLPFILSALIPALAFVLGLLFQRDLSMRTHRPSQRVSRLIPLAISGLAAAAVSLLWVFTREETISSLLQTAYPGERIVNSGEATIRTIVSFLSGPVAIGLTDPQVSAPFGPNASEASTFLMPGLFLLPVAIWVVIAKWRLARELPWIMLSMFGVLVLVGMFMFIPGLGDAFQLIGFDRIPINRMKLMVGLVSLVLFVVTINETAKLRKRFQLNIPKTAWLSSVGLAFVTQLGLVFVIFIASAGGSFRPQTVDDWVIAIGTIVTSTVWLAAIYFGSRGRLSVSALLLVVVAFLSTFHVNPLYKGLYNLNDTEVGRVVDEFQPEKATWIGVGESYLPGAVLVQSGQTAINGFQNSPATNLWKTIDKKSQFESEWNRLAYISWVPGIGDPIPTNPVPDQIVLNFDSCSKIVRDSASLVLSDTLLDQECLTLIREVQSGPTKFWIYRINSARTP